MGLPVPASHRRAVWSLLPVRMSLPSGLKATAITQPWWCITVPRGVRAAASQTRAVPSSLPVRIVLPSGLKATARTIPWCSSGGPSGLPLATSQRCALKPSPPVSTVFPSGLKTPAADPSRLDAEATRCTSLPVAISHKRGMPSVPPVRKSLPSGLTANASSGHGVCQTACRRCKEVRQRATLLRMSRSRSGSPSGASSRLRAIQINPCPVFPCWQRLKPRSRARRAESRWLWCCARAVRARCFVASSKARWVRPVLAGVGARRNNRPPRSPGPPGPKGPGVRLRLERDVAGTSATTAPFGSPAGPGSVHPR